ncbi:VirB8/TrbF family protein [Nitrosospira multiformis]|uniref:VirB8/TrbF family protein n=1 Tax=Nitrosospira multiformis TaxID=1231 RepID=UPI00089B6031|nr:VirB8/TrbF family protein [Nitrosospira multiformis]SEA65514.1 type IV secretion system protein VirB5 [Nitrosospira multiformis]
MSMSAGAGVMRMMRSLILRKGQSGRDESQADAAMVDGRRAGEEENPYLSARRTWNEHMGDMAVSRRNWQMLGLLSLLIALASVGGVIHIGSQAKFIPYVVEVDKLGQTLAVAPVERAQEVDARIVHAAVASFIQQARMVTPDVALQRKAIFGVYAMLSPEDPATAKMNEFMNGRPEASPFRRAEREMVSTEIVSVIAQSPQTWQADWTETVRDRQGIVKNSYRMRALVTVYVAEPSPDISEAQLRNNPLGIYVSDFAWSRQL